MILLDGDIIAYRVAAAIQSGRGDYLDLMETVVQLASEWAAIPNRPEDDVIVCMSSDPNFRKAIYPEYKKHREGQPEPPWRRDAEKFLRDEFYVTQIPTLEGDDVMGILAGLADGAGEEAHLVTIDKDLLQIPGVHYNPMKPKQQLNVDFDLGMHSFHMQWITGDTTDNYKGIPKMGPVKARKFLAQFVDEHPDDIGVYGYRWKEAEPAILGLYKERGLSEEYAIQMAQCAYILRPPNYQDEKVTPWQPQVGVASK